MTRTSRVPEGASGSEGTTFGAGQGEGAAGEVGMYRSSQHQVGDGEEEPGWGRGSEAWMDGCTQK